MRQWVDMDYGCKRYTFLTYALALFNHVHDDKKRDRQYKMDSGICHRPDINRFYFLFLICKYGEIDYFGFMNTNIVKLYILKYRQ